MHNNIVNQFRNNHYQTLILDVDGVIFDSNKTKENNIHLATTKFTNSQIADEFTRYFIGLSGIPREKKINSYFKGDPEVADQILNYYNELNDHELNNAKMTSNADHFIKDCTDDLTLIALSGGSINEIKRLFDQFLLTPHFKYIFGGPKTKEENMTGINPTKPLLYIGDSSVDYEVAAKLGADFIFMYGYTSLTGWQDFLKKNKEIESIKSLDELI